ncbi:RNA polymerase sigma-70 factor [Pricia sp. S334]|uniref:RNA polymerase sigma-70 factor n=1 Tax=Pricia mediterranea TaxID=3076079 RepID=A0ABU3LAE2_9FLAO|nr:RNA polymerase sigma-70 factor [Pricia sp. S334]MDT7830338.1 RNA polymerase sigma-70 factor [Pricia sp. S334]
MEIGFNDNTFLMRQLKKGNEKAYAYLVDTYHHRLCCYVQSLVKDKSKAEDIVQNVFIRTWERRRSLKTEFTIKSFLYRSVHNEFIDQYRRQKSVTTLEQKYMEEMERITPKDDALLEKLLCFVQREIQNLPPKCKKIFLMSKEEGCTNGEIADHLNVTKKTIEYHITKAFVILRQKANDHKEQLTN